MNRAWAHLGAVIAAAASVVVTLLVPALNERSTFLLALAVVFVAAWHWGWHAGVSAAVTSFVMIAWLMPPLGGWISRAGDDVLRFVTFAVLTTAALLFARAHQRAEGRLNRTHQLVAESLTRESAAREALARTNETKERFIALLAHELRTPLNAAMGWLHILRTGQPPEAAGKAAETIARNLELMHALIEDIVDFNRAEFGKLTLNRTRLDPALLVSDIVTTTRTIAEHRRVVLRSEIEDGLPEIDADPKRLRQVLLNIVNNALKFTQPGGQVVVYARSAREGLMISVADNGPGIEPDHLQRVFDPLYQPGGGERSDGLGLGLPLVKRLVEAHGGTVRIESEGGRGTNVTVALPVQGVFDTDVGV